MTITKLSRYTEVIYSANKRDIDEEREVESECL